PAPKPPARLVRRAVTPPGEAARSEWFLAGTEPGAHGWSAASPPAAIVQPADGDILALDPDIPAANQRLGLKARHALADSRWQMDGADWHADTWPLQRGRHRLALLDAGGATLDQVEFEVR
ncbi:MAG: penicillin-binding protein 1C, partial [Thiobacillus sp.]|nr:penicillin-binding protein 1C [Thiobacillus sp.]